MDFYGKWVFVAQKAFPLIENSPLRVLPLSGSYCSCLLGVQGVKWSGHALCPSWAQSQFSFQIQIDCSRGRSVPSMSSTLSCHHQRSVYSSRGTVDSVPFGPALEEQYVKSWTLVLHGCRQSNQCTGMLSFCFVSVYSPYSASVISLTHTRHTYFGIRSVV